MSADRRFLGDFILLSKNCRYEAQSKQYSIGFSPNQYAPEYNPKETEINAHGYFSEVWKISVTILTVSKSLDTVLQSYYI